MRALEALQRTATMRLHAADAHDRVAQLHEMLAEAYSGNGEEHRDLAALHRQPADADRAAADPISRSPHVQPPESEPG